MSFAEVNLPARDMLRQGDSESRPIALFATSRHSVAVRTSIGFLCALGSLALPWLGLNLSPDFSPWTLKLSLGAVPLAHHISYGVVVASLTACALVSFIRSGAQRTVCVRAVGWAYLVLSLTFLLTTRMVDTFTMFNLQSDANQSQIINSQFLTNNNVPPTTQFLGVSFDAKTLLLLYALRMGWFLLPIAGVFLAGRLPRPSNPLQWTAFTLTGLALLAVVAGFGLGIVAQGHLDDGIEAINTGRATAGLDDLSSALRLNPSVAYDQGLQQAIGTAQADQGRQTGLADYSEAVRPVGKDLTISEKARLFAGALAGVPANTPAGMVVRNDLAAFLANATIASKNPALLELVKGNLGAPAVSFTVGRYYYEAGANSLAIDRLTQTYHETRNSEVRSLALTYVALAWLRLGDEAKFRTNIVAAVHDDTLNENVYAREISAGLYVPGTP
jgi:hypothetical protein